VIAIRTNPRVLVLFRKRILLAVMLLSAIGLLLEHSIERPSVAPFAAGTLPGQQIWNHGVSSYLFGTNDSYEYSPQNIESQPAIQDLLRSAGFTLIRTFFRDGAGDASIQDRINTVVNSGANCLGVITSVTDVAYDEHLVEYLGSRCNLYEFGNEPDYAGMSVSGYLHQWDQVIPILRKINPAARFIGPVTSTPEGVNGFMASFLHGVRSSGIYPDAISFHWYPCWRDSETSCLAKAGSIQNDVQTIRDEIIQILGKPLPVALTEWNFDPGSPPPAYGSDPTFMTRFTSVAMHAMIASGLEIACQFDAASYAGYGQLDMFDIADNQPKPQYYAIAAIIATYRNLAATNFSPAGHKFPPPHSDRSSPETSPCSARRTIMGQADHLPW